jgi:hypothetical protein
MIVVSHAILAWTLLNGSISIKNQADTRIAYSILSCWNSKFAKVTQKYILSCF